MQRRDTLAKKQKKQEKHGKQAAGTPATVALTAAGAAFTVHSYEHDPAHPSYGEEAAEAMGVSPDRVFKTLARGRRRADRRRRAGRGFPGPEGAGRRRLRQAGGDGRPGGAERTTGYVRGGISPLGQRKRLRTVLDASASAHATICVSAGRRGLEVELAPGDLAKLTEAVLAPIGRA